MFTNENGVPSVKKIIAAILFGILGLIALGLTFASFETINAGERGLVLRFGKPIAVLGEGLQMVNPITSSVVVFDVRIQKEAVQASAASKDLQIVTTTVALNYHLEPEKVDLLYQKIGKNYKERIIDPAIQEAIKAVTAKYTAEELVTKREMAKQEMKIALFERLKVDFILVDDLSIVNFDFSGSFNQAIENKVTAEQDALAAKNKLEQVKFEAEQRIAQAKGEAEAIKIQAQAITQQGGADYVKLQWIKAWGAGGAKVPNFITSDQSGGFIMNLQ